MLYMKNGVFSKIQKSYAYRTIPKMEKFQKPICVHIRKDG